MDDIPPPYAATDPGPVDIDWQIVQMRSALGPRWADGDIDLGHDVTTVLARHFPIDVLNHMGLREEDVRAKLEERCIHGSDPNVLGNGPAGQAARSGSKSQTVAEKFGILGQRNIGVLELLTRDA